MAGVKVNVGLVGRLSCCDRGTMPIKFNDARTGAGAEHHHHTERIQQATQQANIAHTSIQVQHLKRI
jgi:hypothetical protein